MIAPTHPRLLAEAVATAGVPGAADAPSGTAGDPPAPGAYGSANITAPGPLSEASLVDINGTSAQQPSERAAAAILPVVVAPPGQAEPSSGAGAGRHGGRAGSAAAAAAALVAAAALLL